LAVLPQLLCAVVVGVRFWSLTHSLPAPATAVCILGSGRGSWPSRGRGCCQGSRVCRLPPSLPQSTGSPFRRGLLPGELCYVTAKTLQIRGCKALQVRRRVLRNGLAASSDGHPIAGHHSMPGAMKDSRAGRNCPRMLRAAGPTRRQTDDRCAVHTSDSRGWLDRSASRRV
jgi:hypothetical protein